MSAKDDCDDAKSLFGTGRKKNPWSSSEADTLLSIIGEPGVVVNGVVNYAQLALVRGDQLPSRTLDNIRDKIKNWEKNLVDDKDEENIYKIQARHLEAIKAKSRQVSDCHPNTHSMLKLTFIYNT